MFDTPKPKRVSPCCRDPTREVRERGVEANRVPMSYSAPWDCVRPPPESARCDMVLPQDGGRSEAVRYGEGSDPWCCRVRSSWIARLFSAHSRDQSLSHPMPTQTSKQLGRFRCEHSWASYHRQYVTFPTIPVVYLIRVVQRFPRSVNSMYFARSSRMPVFIWPMAHPGRFRTNFNDRRCRRSDRSDPRPW